MKADIEKAARIVWTPEKFVETFIATEPMTAAEILCATDAAEMSGRQARQLLDAATAKGLIYRLDGHKKHPDRYTTERPTLLDPPPPAEGKKKGGGRK